LTSTNKEIAKNATTGNTGERKIGKKQEGSVITWAM